MAEATLRLSRLWSGLLIGGQGEAWDITLDGRVVGTLADRETVEVAVAPGRQGIDTTRLGRWLRAKSGRVVMMTLHDGRRERVRFEQGGITEGAMRWKLAAIPSR